MLPLLNQFVKGPSKMVRKRLKIKNTNHKCFIEQLFYRREKPRFIWLINFYNKVHSYYPCLLNLLGSQPVGLWSYYLAPGMLSDLFFYCFCKCSCFEISLIVEKFNFLSPTLSSSFSFFLYQEPLMKKCSYRLVKLLSIK